MDARTETQHIPLCVDLDGTLITTDTLWEAVVALVFRNPLMIFSVIGWAMSGKARLKHEIAARHRADAADWLETRIAAPTPGALHPIFHTVAWQYSPPPRNPARLPQWREPGKPAPSPAWRWKPMTSPPALPSP